MPKDPQKKQWPLFSCIEELQGDEPFGRVLDAGTGPRSFRWLKTLDVDSITAVTGDAAMQRKVEPLASAGRDRVLLGNWADPALLEGERFDTVIADYLLGSLEAFAPYFQESLFARLRALTERRLYLTGVEPYVGRRPADAVARLVWQIGRHRDACLLLLGKQPYREFPLAWVVAQLRRSGFEVAATRKFPASYSANFVNSQIDWCRPGLEKMTDGTLGRALIERGERLRELALDRIAAQGSLKHGFSYVVAAGPVPR